MYKMATRNTAIRGLQIRDKAVTVDKMADMGAEAHIFVADDNKRPVSVAMSGDITILKTGATAIGADKVNTTHIGCSADDAGKFLKATAENVVAWTEIDTDAVLDTDIKLEDLSADCDGSEDEFVIDNACVEDSLQVFLNGLLQQKGDGLDYTYTAGSKTITFVTPPEAGDLLLVHYIITP